MNTQTTLEQPGAPAGASSDLFVGKPLIPNEWFVIVQANQTLSTLVSYEGQYKNSAPEAIQKRILELADFIRAQLKAMANTSHP